MTVLALCSLAAAGGACKDWDLCIIKVIARPGKLVTGWQLKGRNLLPWSWMCIRTHPRCNVSGIASSGRQAARLFTSIALHILPSEICPPLLLLRNVRVGRAHCLKLAFGRLACHELRGQRGSGCDASQTTYQRASNLWRGPARLWHAIPTRAGYRASWPPYMHAF